MTARTVVGRQVTSRLLLCALGLFATGACEASATVAPANAEAKMSTPPACPSTSRCLRDPEEVGRARGVDIPMSNYRIVGCETQIKALTKKEREVLSTYLDSILNRDREGFKKGWRDPTFRRPLTTQMNALVGRVVVQDWSADLWEMLF